MESVAVQRLQHGDHLHGSDFCQVSYEVSSELDIFTRFFFNVSVN